MKRIRKLILIALCVSLLLSCFVPTWAEGVADVPPEEIPPNELPLEDIDASSEEIPNEGEVDNVEEQDVPNWDEKIAPLIYDVPHPEAGWPLLEDISAAAYIVADGDTGEIIFDHNGAEIVYPASMTKILTALVVLEHPEFSPNRPIYFSEVSCAMPAPESSTAGYVPGEIAPTISLLYVMMTQSANEVANALAENYGGTIDQFVNLMNAKAQELGCENTHFVDPCGFGQEDHYTTGEDMVKIIKRAMSNPVFRSLVSTKYYSPPPTNIHTLPGWTHVINSNYLMLFYDAGYSSPWLRSVDGVKTGLTDIAGNCLSAAATTHDGRHLISVIFNAIYIGQDTSSFMGPCKMSRTLLEEGAKRLGSPRVENAEVYEDEYYAWPVMAPVETEPEVTEKEPEVIPSYTIAPEPLSTESEVKDASKMEVSKISLGLLILFVSLFLLTSLILGYSLVLARRRERYRSKWDNLKY